MASSLESMSTISFDSNAFDLRLAYSSIALAENITEALSEQHSSNFDMFLSYIHIAVNNTLARYYTKKTTKKKSKHKKKKASQSSPRSVWT